MRILSATSGFMSGAHRALSMLVALGLILGLGAFVWRSARAELQNDVVGFSPNHIFEKSAEGEHIDVMSGNMTLTIPLGPRYKLTDDFSWGLTLYYNAKIWEHECSSAILAMCTGTLPSHPEHLITGGDPQNPRDWVPEPAIYAYGLGFTMYPGRIYRNPLDKTYVFRVQLEDGSDHMFCDEGHPDYQTDYMRGSPPPPHQINPNCGYETSDASHIHMARSTSTESGANIWIADLRDGRTIEFGRLGGANMDTVAFATRVRTTALRTDGSRLPRAWVDFDKSDEHGSYIGDSQGRKIRFGSDSTNGNSTIVFPGYGDADSDPATNLSAGITYELELESLQVHDPLTPPTNPTTAQLSRINRDSKPPDNLIKSIWLPAVDSHGVPYKYEFEYTMPDPLHEGALVSYGMMTRRTLPTGAFINYDYETYPTSANRPYHIELVQKTLTLLEDPNTKYIWNWDRFSITPLPAIQSHDPQHPAADAMYFNGSNPHTVAARDPFNNLTLYEFNATTQDLHDGHYCNIPQGECRNNWNDGTLASVSTYAGPNPDSEHLVRRVEYQWDSDMGIDPLDPSHPTEPTGHKMFQYRAPRGNSYPSAAEIAGYPEYINSVPVNVRQVEEKTFIPGTQTGGHTLTVASSNWYPNCPQARQSDEYLDGELYRRTYTDTFPSGGNCAAHRYVQVTDAVGSLVSRVDRFFDDGQLACEVRRKNDGPSSPIADCSVTGLALQPGDVATVNTLDTSATHMVTQTTVSGGDSGGPRTVNFGYLPYTTVPDPVHHPEVVETGKTPYMTTKDYLKDDNTPFAWHAVNRTVDIATGWTKETHDPAGNTTDYQWDSLGRLTAIIPGCPAPPGGSIDNCPEKPTVISYPSVNETHVKQTLSGTNFVETVYLYDSLGRLVTTKRRNATGGYDIQKTEYDIASRAKRKSEWAPDGTSSSNLRWTTYDYTLWTDTDGPQDDSAKHPDPLGRVHGVTTPDDVTPQTPTTETTYDGTVTTVTVRDIAGWVNDQNTAIISTTKYTKDAFGRLESVQSPSNGASAAYSYDASDNLVEVKLSDTSSNPTQVQVRRFDYDHLGRLRAATSPENGTVFYAAYDARGNLVDYTDARQNHFTMTYDNADRLQYRYLGPNYLVINLYDGMSSRLITQSNYRIENGGSVLDARTQFQYGTADSANQCRPDGIGGYTGLNGRLTWQKTTLGLGGPQVETDFCEDGLGMPSMIRYPDLTNSGRTRTETLSSYRNGYLVSLSDQGRSRAYINNVAYGAGGVPTEIDRVANEDHIDLDVRNRPSRIRVVGYSQSQNTPTDGVTCDAMQQDPIGHPALMGFPCGSADGSSTGGVGFLPTTLWDTGSYSYDVAGNVSQINLDTYRYDALNRLVHSGMVTSGDAYAIDYGYDAFGNMTFQQRMTLTTTVRRDYSIDWRTNRLTSQAMQGSPTLSYTFDENGNLLSEGVPGTGGIGGSRGYVYDPQGRLREVMDPDKGRIGNYSYDVSGDRVRAEADGKEVFYVRDASGQVLSEFQRQLGSTDPPAWNRDYVYAFGKSLALVQNDYPTVPQRPWPTKIGADADLTTRLRLNWLPVRDPDIVSYQIEKRWWRADTDTEERVDTPTVSASVQFWDDSYSAYVASRCVKYRVRAIDSAGNWGDYGSELKVCPQMQDTVPAPSNVTATAGVGFVKLTWSLPAGADTSRVLGYYVTGRGLGNVNQHRINQDFLRTTEFVDTPLPPDASGYRYRVYTIDTSLRVSAFTNASPSPIPMLDTIAPGKITDVTAEAEALAGHVAVSWRPGADIDVMSYAVYRSSTRGGTLSLVGDPVPFVSGQDTYTVHDVGAAEGALNYYTVIASDSRNQSTPSDQVSVRARTSGISTPIVVSPTTFEIDDNGTPTSATAPTGAEADDIIYVRLRWDADANSMFRIYRKAPDETSFRPLGDPALCTIQFAGGGSVCTFRDDATTKAQYTYYVVRVSGPNESAAGVVTVASSFNPLQVTVRDLYVTDGRLAFTTGNAISRLATVHWSRVDQPGLVGYNVYRMCSSVICQEHGIVGDELNAFSCEPEWIRLNDAPVDSDQFTFGDGSTGGLQGCYMYAVRPVGPAGIEGAISTIAVANLRTGAQDCSDPRDLETCSYHGTKAAEIPSDDLKRQDNCTPRVCSASGQGCVSDLDCPSGQGYCTTDLRCTTAPGTRCSADEDCPLPEAPYNGRCLPNRDGTCYGTDWIPETVPVNWALNGPGAGTNCASRIGINCQSHTGSPDGPPSHVATAAVVLKDRESAPASYTATKLAQITWSWGGTEPPSDLVGYHIEVAGSPFGPWQRLTRHPVAWWERRYTVLGVSVPSCEVSTGHTECLRYHVISVDEDGNESQPVNATPDPINQHDCQQTPDPPQNLHATTIPPQVGSSCKTQLDWDPSPGATDYYVYRMVLTSDYTPYFYQTQHVRPLPGEGSARPTYVEAGDTSYATGDCQDTVCNDGEGTACPAIGLQAFYVTAWANGTGESPRSNLVFWDCMMSPGFASLRPPAESTDAIAEVKSREKAESLACWITDGPTAVDPSTVKTVLPDMRPKTVQLMAPSLRLGAILDPDPPWEVYDLHTDHLGTIRAVTKTTPTGTVLVSRHDYFPFGEEIPPQTLSFNTHQYTGHERDYWTSINGTTGRTLDYMLARYYEAGLGRFLSPDPGDDTGPGDVQSWNRFAYVRNNPVSLADPTGKYAGVDDALFAGTGAVIGLIAQGAGDLASGHLSSWESYAGAVVGGAVGGWTTEYAGPVAGGAAAGATSSLVGQGLSNLTGKQSGLNVGEVAKEATVGALTAGIVPDVKVPGITAGRGSMDAVAKQVTTKLENGTISAVSGTTAAKVVTAGVVKDSARTAVDVGTKAAGASEGGGTGKKTDDHKQPEKKE